tara:strand:+ start:9295 stop:10209 length:915 start_codon:yes stop_codon:yes gene_type:complete
MDPFTLALATFGVQKLRGKSTRTALKDAALIGGSAFGIGALSKAGAFGSAAQAGQGFFGNIGRGSPFSSIPGMGGDSNFLKKIIGQKGSPKKEIIKNAAGDVIQDAAPAVEGSGILGADTGTKLIAASTILPLLGGDEEGVKPQFTEEDYKQAYKEQSAKLKGKFEPVDTAAVKPTMAEVTGSNMFYANQGGLATAINKFNKGGVNYLPSKVDHDENDVNNYVRATGYVEDGAGAGDKDEDTMLAQLADGEFVSRADAVLGAGILSGADPKNFKGMRKAGADFFYNQQKQFKRIYDITNASKQN